MGKATDPQTLAEALEAGLWLQARRRALGLSQLDLAQRLGKTASWVAGVENGRARVPPRSWREWAAALEIEPRILARELLRRLEPEVASLVLARMDNA
ncbi:helix-turn-helix domain-containing protein [Paracraurococcus lichenis]|uniref:Helix-turn-helix transcriptional regulator n=1 Tax=Paracraurococcus lichenis TaxID=3064888 RepID=A0ABT9E8D7_9PROT|nr:helix-turn-helix transcriptional regulator [Paracraurococcus sp. LOR1-02]MDO9712476.1 helix-turn-helix transcriptional regulator [Paracraurococcus sp. LOR1-02]